MVGATVAVVLLVIPWGPFPGLLKTFIVVVVAISITLAAMRFLTPRETKESLDEQFGIFKMKHTWIMTYLYVMTFGSFIGYANAFPKLIDDVFGVIRVGEQAGQATGLESAGYIWIGAGVGALIRPLGGWLSDKVGGARVTHWDTIIMIASTVGAGYVVSLAMTSPDPSQYFIVFLMLFIVLFATTGIGNGSTFRMIGVIFQKEHGALPIQVRVGWSEHDSMTSRKVTDGARAIVAAVTSMLPLAAWESVELNCIDAPGLPREITSVVIVGYPETYDPHWTFMGWGTYLEPWGATRIQAAISAKVNKPKAYEDRYDQLWLQLVAEGTAPSSVATLSEQDRQTAYMAGPYDKVFFFDVFNDTAIELVVEGTSQAP